MAVGDAHYLALGRVAHEFSLLEHMATIAIWTGLCGANDIRSRVVTAEMMARAKFSLLRSLVRVVEKDDARRAGYEKVLDDAEEVAKERNLLLHSPLYSSDLKEPTDVVTAMTVSRRDKNRGEYEVTDYDLKEMSALAERTRDVRRRLVDLMTRRTE